MHTDPALAERRRDLKLLLARDLSGEPWRQALTDPIAVPSPVVAAVVVSYVSRRDPDWHCLNGDGMATVVAACVVADRAAFVRGVWPFLDALERLLEAGIDWNDLEARLAPYQAAWMAPAMV